MDAENELERFIRIGEDDGARQRRNRICMLDRAGGWVMRPCAEGELALFYISGQIYERPYDPYFNYAFHWGYLASQVKLRAPENYVVVDIGSGVGRFSALLCTGDRQPKRVLNIERSDIVLEGARILEDIGMADRTGFLQTDLSDLSAAAESIRDFADGLPVVFATKASLFAYHDQEGISRLIAWMRDLGIAGHHVELVGHLTPEFSVIRDFFGGNPPKHPEWTEDTQNCFPPFENNPSIRIIARKPILPSFLTFQHASYLGWET